MGMMSPLTFGVIGWEGGSIGEACLGVGRRLRGEGLLDGEGGGFSWSILEALAVASWLLFRIASCLIWWWSFSCRECAEPRGEGKSSNGSSATIPI